MTKTPEAAPRKPEVRHHPFRRAILRGLGILLPPLLTIIVFLWAGNIIVTNVLLPVEGFARHLLVWGTSDVQDGIPSPVQSTEIRRAPNGTPQSFQWQGVVYVPLEHDKWIPQFVYYEVRQRPGKLSLTTATPQQYYEQYVSNKYLRRRFVLPIFAGVFIVVLYLLGKFMAAGVGRIFWNFVEGLIHRLPIIRNVYSSVKQVTDFVFSEREIEFNRVVALEYPRKGIWAVGFVTGESMLDIRSAANEPVLSVLIPTSPMPATGFTVTVPKSETIDLQITIDQAIQYVVSAGVVVPPHQQQQTLHIHSEAAGLLPRRETPPAGGAAQPLVAGQRIDTSSPGQNNGADTSSRGPGLKRSSSPPADGDRNP